MSVAHSHVPPNRHAGIIIPFLKSSNLNKSVLSPYRHITLYSLYGKVLDSLVLHRYHDTLETNKLQFGFISHHSINHCTFLAIKVITYYINNGFDVCSCAIDMQKAIERVNLLKIF